MILYDGISMIKSVSIDGIIKERYCISSKYLTGFHDDEIFKLTNEHLHGNYHCVQ